jgi:hypothetical protein
MEENFERVEVEWTDAQSSLDAISISELEKHPLVTTKSCGYLIKKDKEKIVLAFMVFGMNRYEEAVMKHYQIIPTGMVKKIVKLKNGKM